MYARVRVGPSLALGGAGGLPPAGARWGLLSSISRA